MLESVTLKRVATYNETGIVLGDLKKINIIYGANGSGKTTLTKVIDRPTDPAFAHCSLSWRHNQQIKALVYNRDFRSKNFGNGTIAGVFTLGQATKEQIEAIQTMVVEMTALKTDLIQKQETHNSQVATKQEAENEFKESLWTDIYKKYETVFKDAFAGVMKKDSFKAKILSEHKSNRVDIRLYEDLKESANTIFGKPPESMPLINIFDHNSLVEIESNSIWEKKIIGKADVHIAKLIQHLNLNDWVNEGRKHLSDETCPFCQQQTITDEFRKQIEQYFDDSYITDLSLVKSLSDQYKRQTENFSNLIQLIEATEKSNTRTKLNIDLLTSDLKTTFVQFNSNQESVNNKLKEPSRILVLLSSKEQLESIYLNIQTANQEIRKHNKIVDNYSAEKNSLITSIWRFISEESKAKIDNYISKVTGLQRGIDSLNSQVQELKKKQNDLDRKIKEANKNVTSVQPSVDEINRILKSFGFLNFEIVPSKAGVNQYQIHRSDGTIAESTLSEGEITFITFLYFLQLAKGGTSQESISDDRILIVDDPISSLDSNVLFVVSALLKEIVKSIKKDYGNIKQLLIFTHNVYFHKEVSFVDGRTKINGDTHYWILRKTDNTSSIDKFEMKNPIQSSYELLWRDLKQNKRSITTQNTMRRIIENYFEILGKYGDDDLINKFDNTQDQEICRSLICWINDGSHSLTDDLYVEYHETTIDKYATVFERIFTQMGHSEHYNMMMAV